MRLYSVLPHKLDFLS